MADFTLLGTACQFPSLHRIETECRQGVLGNRIGPLSEDTIGYAPERQDPTAILALGCDIVRQLKRNQVLASTWSRGLVVAAVDGIEICNSFVRCCPHCMERMVKHKVGEETREEIQYYHGICAVAIVSAAFPIPLGIRFQKQGQTEVACTLALGLDWVMNLKDNQPELLAEAQRVTDHVAPNPILVGQPEELQLLYAPQLIGPLLVATCAC